MKNYYTLFLLGFSTLVFCQAPTNYYDGTQGLTGYPLKTKLSEIISNGHQDKGYNAIWTAFSTTDRDDFYENDGSILDMYSESPSGSDIYTYQHSIDQCGSQGFKKEGDCYNREHILPQSFFNAANPMRNDIHFVTPVDGWVNTMHSNLPYGEVFDPIKTSMAGAKRGNNTFPGYDGTVFEPIDEFKGDIARMLLYFITRYESRLHTFNSSNTDSPFDGSNDRGYKEWYINELIRWSKQDPVNQREINRNNAAYTFQGNRNPFIDHPEWVETIWTTTLVEDITPPTQVLNIKTTHLSTTSANIEWDASTDNVGVIGYIVYLNGQEQGKTTVNNYYFMGLTEDTDYEVKVVAIDAMRNRSTDSNILAFKTLKKNTEPGNSLYFSEYMEGSGYNKALEIANKTGNVVNLGGYTVKVQFNGTGDWKADLPLSGSLNNNSVYVIGHSKIATPCTPARIDLSTSSTTMTFNGNDAIGLFQGDTLVDIIGTFNDSSNYAVDKTLRRNVNAGNIQYNNSEWDIFAKDSCDDLGLINNNNTLKTQDSKAPANAITLVENPVKGGEVKFKGTQLKEVKKATVYNSLGKIVLSISNPFTNSNSIILKNELPGVYFIILDNTTFKFSIR
ncbi:hypothetical protein IQ37_02580 [Chryseobacterium piperi]|uniref:Endonuclease I n=1 Tax=Chryseobacterium piperi TaxID=558152 RepID=A0A086BMA3_9FLAO|nr:endonuclease [Chryseobacterium piperi]ATL75989.1 T9SS C-terminal target domain-containing protein [Chryseobacterium piperi]KFF30067.1 hypothetical protein IQ37_02580 [Chryseobacterium piperi]